VLIAPNEQLAALQQHLPTEPGDLLTFSDTEPLQALEAISNRRPTVVALERAFASSPRGSALIGRIKADPSLAHAEVLVVATDDENSLKALRQSGSPAGKPGEAPATAAASVDYRGTRRAPRVRIADHVTVMVDGHVATLIDLSTIGAQVVSVSILRPNQRVRVVMADDRASVKCSAIVAWAAFEIPPKSAPQYRAGLQFIDAAPSDVSSYCDRHKAHSTVAD
jgi:hypothetical protein